jgi:hypothetical protein
MKIWKIIVLSSIFVLISLVMASCFKPQADVPYAPTLISPANGTTLNSTSVTLSWSCSDPQNKPLNYTIYFNKNSSTPTTIIASGLMTSFYNVNVSYNTNYSWMVVAHNSVGGVATGSVWTFKVGVPLPVVPYNPIPQNGQTNVSTSTQLSWQCYSPDGSFLNYTVFFGTSANVQVATQTTNNYYNPGTLMASTTYYWKVEAQNLSGGTSTSLLWHFTTKQKAALPPLPPSNPSPSNGATEVQPSSVKLSWQDSDPQGYPLKYMVYLGKVGAMTLIATTSTSTYTVNNLNYGTVYNWQIVAFDPYGNIATGTVWTFTTFDQPPNTPQLFSPANFSTNISANNLEFSWTCPDPDGNPLTYNLYVGTSTNVPLYKSGITGNSYTTNLNWNTTYYWKIVAVDPFGKTATSAVWNFTTSNPPIQPPTPPANPSPANGVTAVSLTPTLSWTCSDPQNYPLTYDLYFGTTQNPPLIQSNLTSPTYSISSSLSYSTTYYWYVVAKDNKGNSTKGPVWTFTTISQPPAAASNPYPTNESTGVSPDTQLSWQGGSGLTYNVYLGTSQNSMSEVVQGLSSEIYTPPLNSLSGNTTYYWKIVTTNSGGGQSTSPVWSFTTGTNSSSGRVTIGDQVVGANQPFTLSISGIGISNFQGMEIKLGFDPSKVAINTSQGQNGVSLAGPIANATLMKPTVTSTMIDINIAILGSGNAVNIPNNVILNVYFTNMMTSGYTKISTIYLDARDGSNQQMNLTYSDVGVIRIQ